MTINGSMESGGGAAFNQPPRGFEASPLGNLESWSVDVCIFA